MVVLITPPPSSSPTQLALDKSAAASPCTTSKRKKDQPDDVGPLATKRQCRPDNQESEQDEIRYANQINETQSASEGDRGLDGQPSPCVPSVPEHVQQQQQQQQQQHNPPVARINGKAAAKKLSRAAIDRPPGDDFFVYKGQAMVQSGPSDPAQPPASPHSTQNHGHWAYTVSNAGIPTYEQRPWIDPQAHPLSRSTTIQPQHHTQWMNGPGMSAPHHAMSQSQQQLMTGYDLCAPSVNFPGHYQSHPLFKKPTPGTASRPIVLDDSPQDMVSTSTQLHTPQQQPPQFSTVHSVDSTPFLAENAQRHPGVNSFTNLPPASPLGNASNLWRPLLHQPHGAVESPQSGWDALGSSAVFFEPMHNPYGYLDQQPGIHPRVFSTEYHQNMPQAIPQAPEFYPPAVLSPQLLQPSAKAPARKSKPPKLTLPTDEPVLCPEQKTLVDLITQGHNVFYTGSAGCGKSTVLRAFVKRLADMGKTVRIVAPTGRAALNVGGMTTWTFAGWTPNSHKKTLQRLKSEAVWGSKVNERLKDTDVLVIDEISMVENLHFERLNEIMKAVHHKPHGPNPAFGGCQIVVTGDFCQLPPVKPFQHCIQCGKELSQRIGQEGKGSYRCRDHGEYADEDKWAFKSKAWEECEFKNVHLRTIHRQNDEPFIRMLQKCRLGSRLSEQEIDLLMNHKNRTSQAMELYPTRKEADDINRAKFNKIAAEPHTYWAHDSFFWHKEHHPNLQWKGVPSEWRNSWTLSPPQSKRPLKALDEHRYGECVQLKKGGLVVLLTNLDLKLGLCNGSQGVICGFEDYDPAMVPTRDTRGELSWGKKKAETVEPNPGQRVLRGEHAAIQEKEIKNFITSECAPIKKWPIVRFHNGQKCTVYAECSITQLGDEEPYSLLARTQLPLAPAWAMTIHKSQSLTLDRVIVNLDRVFEEGQVYVALSRATGLYGLKIDGDGHFLRDKIMVNSEVATFLRGKFKEIYEAMEPESGSLGSVEAS